MIKATPMVREAIRLLSLSRIDLVRFIREEVTRNPFLEISLPFNETGKNNIVDTNNYIDLEIKKINGEYNIVLCEIITPKLKINAFAGKDGKDLNAAIWFIKGINRRQEILYKVTDNLVRLQQEFLDKGERFLKKVTLNQVAKLANVHQSTVSRVIRNKYIKTDRGTFELKYLLGQNIFNGQFISREQIKKMIKGIIQSENKRCPLNDKQILEKLKEDNVPVVKRTVTKYRNLMGTPNFRKRKLSYSCNIFPNFM